MTSQTVVTARVRIKVGALVGQDHAFGRWPWTRDGVDVDQDMVFDAEWDGRWWDCRADGYGRKSWLGDTRGYGNGSIGVMDLDGVEILTATPKGGTECAEGAV